MSNETMPDNTSPRPWRFQTSGTLDPVTQVVDSDGRPISDRAHIRANLALIVQAVNERDTLRDLVRRLAHGWESSIRECDPRANEVLTNPHNLANALIREAHKLLGDSK